MSYQPPADWLRSQTLAHASALPAPLYTCPQAFAAEQSSVFAHSWQLVAHAAQLAHTGDHVVTDIAGLPLLVVRDSAGTLRAFHNVCRHRAGPLALCDGRGARALRCRYHGWTYTLEGDLRSAPDMAEASGFDVADVRLPEVQVACWRGHVFVAVAAAPALDLVLDGVDARVGSLPIEDYVFDRRISYTIAANWKTYVDNYLEGYHLPHIHPGLNRLLDYRSYTTTTAAWHSLQASPIRDAENFYGSGEALYYFVYPNTMLNILPGRLQTNRIVPIDAGHCRIDFDYFYPADTVDAAEVARREQDLAFSDEVQHEDIGICEAVQQRLASGSYVAGRLSPRRESGVHHFHELIRQAWREAGSLG